MALSSNKYALIAPSLEKILAQIAAPKVSKWQSYGKFCKVTLNPDFSEKVKRGDQGKLFKNRRFWRKKRLQRVPEWPSYGNFRQLTHTRIF